MSKSYYLGPFPEDPEAVVEDLRPGANVMILCDTLEFPRYACYLEDMGLQIRDCFSVVTPDQPLNVLYAIKPLEGTYVDNALEHGVAGLNIDAGRISCDSEVIETSGEKVNTPCHDGYTRPNTSMFSTNKPKERSGPANLKGRYPSNFILMHHPDCECVGTKRVKPSNGSGRAYEGDGDHQNDVYGPGLKYRSGVFGAVGEDGTETVEDWQCAQGCPVKALDEQTEDVVHGAGHAREGSEAVVSESYRATSYETGQNRKMHRFGDSGGASRFFKQVRDVQDLLDYLRLLLEPPEEIS